MALLHLEFAHSVEGPGFCRYLTPGAIPSPGPRILVNGPEEENAVRDTSLSFPCRGLATRLTATTERTPPGLGQSRRLRSMAVLSEMRPEDTVWKLPSPAP